MVRVLVKVTTAATKHHEQSKMGGQGLLHSQFHITVHHQKPCGQELKQSKNLEAGADAEAMEECCLLVLLPRICSVFLIECKTTSLGMASPTKGWFLLHQSLIKKMPYRLAYR